MGPQQKESHREILRTRQVWADEVGHSVQDEFCVPLLLFITCNAKLILSQIQVLKDYELLVVYVTKITTTLMLLLQILQSI